MEKYDFSLGENTVSVFPFYGSEYDRQKAIQMATRTLSDGDMGVLMYPVSNADFGITCFDNDSLKPREPKLALVALSCYFRMVRGLGHIPFDVEILGRIYEIGTNVEENKVEKNPDKCKLKYAKNIKFYDGIENEVFIYSGEKTVAVIVCDDAQVFSLDRLKLLCSPVYLGVDSAAAVSYCGDVLVRMCGSLSCYDILSAATAALVHYGVVIPEDRMRVIFDGAEYIFSYIDGALVLYQNVKYLS